jgi:DNA replication and repair protein RecF
MRDVDQFSGHIRLLRLYHFRTYGDRVFEVSHPRVMIAGPNGSGKTNILEALSLFTVGTGLRGAKLGAMQSAHNVGPWAVHLDWGDDDLSLGTALDADALAQGKERRLLHINDLTGTQQDLSDHLHIVWHTPKMDRLFAEGLTERRRFWDRTVYGFYPDHLTHLRAYEAARRERAALFDRQVTSSAWHRGLESILAEKAVAIAAARLDVVRILNGCVLDIPFRYAPLSCAGWVEDALMSGQSALFAEESYRNHLESLRPFCKTEGPHQSAFSAFDVHKNVDAALGSTGEQKIFVLGIQLRIAHLLAARRRTLLLLDDITSHLDPRHCHELAGALNTGPFVTWLSTVNPENLGSLDAQRIDLGI